VWIRPRRCWQRPGANRIAAAFDMHVPRARLSRWQTGLRTWSSCRWCFITLTILDLWHGSAIESSMMRASCFCAQEQWSKFQPIHTSSFPSTPSILEQRLPTNAVIRQVFEAVGFRTLTFGLVIQQIAPNHAAYADKLAAGGDSVLASVSPEELDAGLEAIRSCTVGGDAGVVEPIDFFVFG
jgi:hypothetical protein